MGACCITSLDSEKLEARVTDAMLLSEKLEVRVTDAMLLSEKLEAHVTDAMLLSEEGTLRGRNEDQSLRRDFNCLICYAGWLGGSAPSAMIMN